VGERDETYKARSLIATYTRYRRHQEEMELVKSDIKRTYKHLQDNIDLMEDIKVEISDSRDSDSKLLRVAIHRRIWEAKLKRDTFVAQVGGADSLNNICTIEPILDDRPLKRQLGIETDEEYGSDDDTTKAHYNYLSSSPSAKDSHDTSACSSPGGTESGLELPPSPKNARETTKTKRKYYMSSESGIDDLDCTPDSSV
jgi:hypothetical protein